MDEKKLVSLTQTLAKSFQKITFAGGEPTICSFLPRLMSVAREEGVLVNVITNGSLINEEWITKNAKLIDLLTVSIDSDKPETHSALGRCFGGVGKTCSNEHYLKLGEACRKNGIKVKMNTVVTEINKNENMTNFITALRPYRWKILQAMPVKGQNDEYIGQLTPSLSDFNKYVEFHKKSLASVPEVKIVGVPIEAGIIGSYIMVDPLGRFIDDSRGCNTYSKQTIFEVGVEAAFAEMNYDLEKFEKRGGTADFQDRIVTSSSSSLGPCSSSCPYIL